MKKSEKKMSQIKKLAAEMLKANFKINIWKSERIYINGYGKDINTWINFDEPLAVEYNTSYDGCSLKVFSNASQDSKWKINRAKQVKFSIMEKLVEIKVVESVCEKWQDVILF